MGIRFYCPNGHKLNVKAHLAGKTGFCPECGARLVIPFESTRKSSKELLKEALQIQASEIEPSPTQNDETPKDSGTLFPALQDPNMVWYVQTPGGPQYGPATGAEIHSWIQQHRISGDMLVWCEGWENWREAKEVFPEME